jgi:hypothetical protein
MDAVSEKPHVGEIETGVYLSGPWRARRYGSPPMEGVTILHGDRDRVAYLSDALPGDVVEYIVAVHNRQIADAVAAERERCAQIARDGWMVPPDGGNPTDGEVAVCDRIKRAILNPNN